MTHLSKLKIGMLSSWRTTCGIAEYSRYIAHAMWKRQDIHFHLLGSRNYGARALPPDQLDLVRKSYIHECFDVELWNSEGLKEMDVEWILEQNYDVLHCQYEIILYPRPQIYELFERFQGIKAITYHDNCFLPDFPYDLFDLRYTHREDVGLGDGYLLEMGAENRPPVVKTFGLGRSREDLIAEICYRNGWHFEKSFGEQEWKSQDELYTWLRNSDAIVLYYEDAPAAGTSIAARVALSTRRPVFINGVTWFRGLEEGTLSPNLRKVRSSEALERGLREALKNEYLERNSWEKIADILVKDYRKALSEL